MCKENEPEARDGNTSTCCYNSYFNGLSCVRCPAGFYGNNCTNLCKNGFYGEECLQVCYCSHNLCHHITGCSTDYPSDESSSIPNRDSENSSTIRTSPDSDTNPVKDFTTENTYIISHINVTGIRKIMTKPSTTSTQTIKSDAPIIPTTSNPLDTNLILMAIGGVIALFLGVIMVQLCIKLRTKRRKYIHQMSEKQNSATEEETYQEINDSLMTVGQNDNHNELRHFGKYYDLHTSGQTTSVPYERIKNQSQSQEINDDSFVASTNSSDSNDSTTSYLEPKTSKRQSNEEDINSVENIKNFEQENQSDHKQLGKYNNLQPTNPVDTVPYKQIHTKGLSKDINETLLILSTSSGSNNSNASYLKPKPKARHGYMEAVDPDPKEDGISLEDNHVSLSDDSSNHTSSQYLDPIHDAHTEENVSESHDNIDTSDGYLDVINETFL